jgi:outer membrane lipoprotein carrier protein
MPAMLVASFEFLTSFQADFFQYVEDGSGRPIQYKGTLYAKSPSSVLWKYTHPIEKHIYIHNKSIWIYEVDLAQVILSNLSDSLDFLRVLQQAKHINPHHYETTHQGTLYAIKTDSNNLPRSIVFLDHLENNITITFHNATHNISFAHNFFQFIPPSHVDVIRQ